MKGDRGKLYQSSSDFFDLEGSVSMKLTSAAAVGVCRSAASKGLLVARIEGGLWISGKFQSRRDCIWDGASPPVALDDAQVNNESAARYIEDKSDVHNVFVITAPSIKGWDF